MTLLSDSLPLAKSSEQISLTFSKISTELSSSLDQFSLKKREFGSYISKWKIVKAEADKRERLLMENLQRLKNLEKKLKKDKSFLTNDKIRVLNTIEVDINQEMHKINEYSLKIGEINFKLSEIQKTSMIFQTQLYLSKEKMESITSTDKSLISSLHKSEEIEKSNNIDEMIRRVSIYEKHVKKTKEAIDISSDHIQRREEQLKSLGQEKLISLSYERRLAKKLRTSIAKTKNYLIEKNSKDEQFYENEALNQSNNQFSDSINDIEANLMDMKSKIKNLSNEYNTIKEEIQKRENLCKSLLNEMKQTQEKITFLNSKSINYSNNYKNESKNQLLNLTSMIEDIKNNKDETEKTKKLIQKENIYLVQKKEIIDEFLLNISEYYMVIDRLYKERYAEREIIQKMYEITNRKNVEEIVQINDTMFKSDLSIDSLKKRIYLIQKDISDIEISITAVLNYNSLLKDELFLLNSCV